MTSALTGETAPIARDALAFLFSVPQSKWTDVTSSGLVTHLCKRGLLLADEHAELLRRDRQLSDLGWLPAAAVYHFSTRSSGARVAAPDYERIVDERGAAPPAFHGAGGASSVELPLVERENGLYDALSRRRTARDFEDRPISLEQLAVLLYEVFGCRGRARLHPKLEVLRKGSPSAGSLHPIEAYPLIQRVEGIAAGIYHYGAREHALQPLADLETEDVGVFTAQQTWFATAPLAVVLAARFRRSFWKYHRHRTAYAALLMDAAHLSQSLYLVAAELGLAAFFTNVINAIEVDRRLGLDGLDEGAIAVCGCGYALRTSTRTPQFEAFVPGRA